MLHASIHPVDVDELPLDDEGYATLVLREQPVSETPLELVLEAGRSVRVTLVGPHGELIPDATVVARDGAIDLATAWKPAALGVYVLEHLTAGASARYCSTPPCEPQLLIRILAM